MSTQLKSVIIGQPRSLLQRGSDGWQIITDAVSADDTEHAGHFTLRLLIY